MANVLSRAAFVAMGFGAVTTTVEAETAYRGYEAPPYQVERVIGDAEIRLYGSYINAKVTVRGDQSAALSRGFGVLANYIFGGNTSSASVDMTSPVAQRPSESIAMTSPVSQTGGKDDLWTVTFTMPSQYTLETLPAPKADTIRFVEVPPERQLVLRFSGWGRTDALNLQTSNLRQIAEAEGLNISDDPSYYFYDDPLTLPWNRRNEVAFVLIGAGQ